MDLNNLDLIDLYLRNELSEEAKINFLSTVNKDIKLQKELDLRKSMYDFLKNKSKKDSLKNHLNTLGNQYFEEEEIQELERKRKETTETGAKVIPIRRKLYFLMAIAGAILFLIATSNSFKSDLYSSYSEHETINFTVKGESTTLLQESEILYNSKKYEEAIIKFEELIKTKSENKRIFLAYGISLLKINQKEKAIIVFEELTQSETFRNAANWYLALIYLKKNNSEKGKTYLEKIPDSDPYYYQKASKILGGL